MKKEQIIENVSEFMTKFIEETTAEIREELADKWAGKRKIKIATPEPNPGEEPYAYIYVVGLGEDWEDEQYFLEELIAAFHEHPQKSKELGMMILESLIDCQVSIMEVGGFDEEEFDEYVKKTK